MWKVHESTDGDCASPRRASQSPKRGRNVWLWIERALLASGFALLAVYGTARIESIFASRAALDKFAAINSSAATASRNDAKDMNSSQVMDSSEVDFRLWDAHRVQAYKESLRKQLGAPLAVLHIPKIHLEVPLLNGTDDLTLNHAVGRIAGTARPGERGNIGIAGHRDGFFRGLKDVVVGDAIELKTLDGTDTYVVDEMRIVSPTDVEVLQPGSVPSLTLVTCYPFYFVGSAPQRYIVMASLTREEKSGLRKSDTRSAIPIRQLNKENR